jgi:PQQ-like domain
MTDMPPLNLDYDDSDISLNIGALLARGRKARRRRKLLLAGVTGATALALAAAGAGIAAVLDTGPSTTSTIGASIPSPWTQTQGNAADSHSNISETTLTPSTVTRMRHLRTYTPSGASACVSSAGSVLAGHDVITVVNGDLVRYVAKTDHTLWQTSVSDGTAVDLGVTTTQVIVGYHSCGAASPAEGWITAYSLATGEQTWRSFTIPICHQGTCSRDDGLAGMGIGAGDDIIIGGNAPGFGYRIAVLNASNGSPVWQDTTSSCAVSAPVVVDQQVIFTRCDSSGKQQMVADALATGKRAWQDAGNWTVQKGDFSQDRGNNLLATEPTGTVVDVDPANGKVLRRLTGAGTVLADDGIRAYTSCASGAAGGNKTSLCGYALSSGQQQWKSDSHPTVKLAAEAGGVLYLDDGTMLNAASGTTLGTAFTPPSSGLSGISVGEGRLNIVTPTTSQLYGLSGE